MRCATAAVALLVLGCGKKSISPGDTADAAPSPKAVVYAPGPFSGIRIGMTEAELKEVFPPVEDVAKCSPRLIGGNSILPTQVPGAENKPRAQCPRSYEIGGIMDAEDAALDEWVKSNNDRTSRNRIDPSDLRASGTYTLAQVGGLCARGL